MVEEVIWLNPERNKNRIQSAAKVFLVLEELAKNDGRMKLSQLAKKIDAPASSAHRLVSSLMDLGYVNQDPDTGEYLLGLRLLSLASVVLRQLDLRKVAYPYLEKLRDRIGETANLVVLDQGEALYIEKVESRSAIRAFSLIGRRAPVHATGVGKLLLADLAWPDVLDIVREKGMPALTDNTITDVEKLMDELNTVRKQGYAIDDEECEIGVFCLAAPVRNHTGKTVASLSISGPKVRVSCTDLCRHIEFVKEQANQMSIALGYNENYLKT